MKSHLSSLTPGSKAPTAAEALREKYNNSSPQSESSKSASPSSSSWWWGWSSSSPSWPCWRRLAGRGDSYCLNIILLMDNWWWSDSQNHNHQTSVDGWMDAHFGPWVSDTTSDISDGDEAVIPLYQSLSPSWWSARLEGYDSGHLAENMCIFLLKS